MRILLTGFEPFDGEPVNAAWEVVSTMAGTYANGHVVEVRQLPTVFGRSAKALQQHLLDTQPDVVMCVGQAGGRSAISLERVGLNLDDARIPDNDGHQPMEQPIVANGPAAYFSTLPLREMVDVCQKHGIPAEVSLTAGTYVCNHVLYQLMHLLQQPECVERKVRGGFIHIPFLPMQAIRHHNAPSLAGDLVRSALTLFIEEVI